MDISIYMAAFVCGALIVGLARYLYIKKPPRGGKFLLLYALILLLGLIFFLILLSSYLS